MIPREITIHHSASSRDKTKVGDVENWHKVRWPNFISSMGWHIGYHYLITGDGVMTQCRRLNEIGAHCIPNTGKVGICLTGNFDMEEPSQKQFESLGKILKELKKLEITKIYGHCEKSATACPGIYLMDWIRTYRKLNQLLDIWKKLKLRLGLA